MEALKFLPAMLISGVGTNSRFPMSVPLASLYTVNYEYEQKSCQSIFKKQVMCYQVYTVLHSYWLLV